MATTTRVLDANVNGTVYTSNANAALEALDTCHSGATAPTNEVANGKLWLDTTTTPGILKMYNNLVWEVIGGSTSSPTFNTVTATTLLGDGAGITGVATADQGTLADTAVQPADNISTLTNDAGYLTVAPSPFEPTTVTGTTPSLDIGSYNFFDNGTLSGDTTVSFASVPTEANWRYRFNAVLQDAWDISAATYLQNFSVAAQDASIRSLSFKPDGTKMYVLGAAGVDVNEYDLITAWDISTAVYLQLFSLSAQDAGPTDLSFKPDGTKMYVTGFVNDAVYEYDLSTAWDISTAVYLQNFSVATQDGTPYDLSFKPDGTKMYVLGVDGVDINEYDVGAPTTLTLPASVQNLPTETFTGGDNVTYEFYTLDGGTTVTLINEEVL